MAADRVVDTSARTVIDGKQRIDFAEIQCRREIDDSHDHDLLQSLNQRQHFFALGLISCAIDQQSRGTFRDDLEHFESVFLQRSAGLDEIHDAIGKTDQAARIRSSPRAE